MTQYTERVQAHKDKTESEEWGKCMKYIHTNNGVIETAFNNGDIKYETRVPLGGGKVKYKTTWHRENIKEESLIAAWGRWLVDREWNQ
jgi:hypothetical protein